MVVPFMTLYMTQKLGFSLGQAGWVMPFFGAGAICGGLLGGKLIDKFGFYYIQIVTLLGGGLMFFVLGQMRTLPTICAAAFTVALINDMFRPANSAAIAHYSKEENRTRSFSLNRLSINLGWAFGGALGGFVASKNYELLFWIDGFTNISAAFILWLTLAPSKNKATQQKPVAAEMIANAKSPYKDKPFMFFFVLSVLFAACFFQLFTTLPVYYREEMRFNEQYIGILMALNGILIAFFEMVLVHKLEGRRHIMQYIMVGVMMAAASFAVFNVLPNAKWVAVTSVLLITFGEMISMPFMMTYWINRTNEGNRGQYAGLYTVSWSVAQTLGPLAGAQIAEHNGFAMLWWVVAGVFFLTALGFKTLERE